MGPTGSLLSRGYSAPKVPCLDLGTQCGTSSNSACHHEAAAGGEAGLSGSEGQRLLGLKTEALASAKPMLRMTELSAKGLSERVRVKHTVRNPSKNFHTHMLGSSLTLGTKLWRTAHPHWNIYIQGEEGGVTSVGGEVESPIGTQSQNDPSRHDEHMSRGLRCVPGQAPPLEN